VGFQIEDYCTNFIECCQRGLGCRVDREGLLVELGGRTVRVRPLPISIPFERFHKMAIEAEDSNWTDLQVILGVDRLDYTKGLINRFRAFERLLSDFPEFLERVMLLQVAVPSRTDVREYQDLKETMDKLVGQINGRFSTSRWSPIRYIYGCIQQSQLAGFYRDADVALVTPLRDGMNLVAKEFVACRTRDPGVLILSPFAGAAGMMREALLVNPYEIGTVANMLARALKMPQDEREVRMIALRKREKINNVDYWMNSFLKAIGTLIEEDGELVLVLAAADSCLGEEVLQTQMQPVQTKDFEEYLGGASTCP
jgi:trehalose 6-phosphate synthase/phosphatase